MKSLSPNLARMGIATRLICASFLTTIVGLLVATFFSVNLARNEAREKLDVLSREQLSFLSNVVSDSLESQRYGRVELILNEFLLLPGVKAVGFRSETEALLLESNAPLLQTAPEWFVSLCTLDDRQSSRLIEMGGHKIGELTLTLSPLPIINRTWEFLFRQLLVLLGGASIVVLGVAFALRANLKPFAVLLEGSRALGRGDFTHRLRETGSSEFREVITTFNTMTTDIELLVDSLSDSQRLYSTLVETAAVGVYRSDLNGKLTYVNPELRKLAGAGNATLDNEVWFSCIHPEDRDRAVSFLMRAIRDPNKEASSFRYLWPDGTIVWVQTQLARIEDSGGRLAGFVGTVTNISAEIKLHAHTERLSRLYSTLSKVNASIVQVHDEPALLESVCRAFNGTGLFQQTSFSAVDWERRKIRQVLSFGSLKTPMQYLERDLDDPDTFSVSNLALLSGTMVTVSDFAADARLGPKLREVSSLLHMTGATAVPFYRSGRIVGALSIVSSEKDFFTDDIRGLIDEIGRDVSFALDNIDLAQQKQLAEEAVYRSEQNLNVTLRSIGDAVLVTDNAGKVTMMNPIAEDLTGWSEVEARGRSAAEVFRIINQETREVVVSPIDMVLRDGKIVGLANHTVLIAKDGTERPIADSGAPIRYGEDGEVNGVVLVFRDQSDEYRILKALRDKEQLYSQLVDSAPVGIFQTNASGGMVFANDVLLNLAGVSRDDMSPERWAAAYHPYDREQVGKAWTEAMRLHVPAEATTYRYVRPDGSVTWAQASATPLISDKGELNGYVGVVTDVSTLKEFEDRISQLAYRDALTDLPNRTLLRDRVEQSISLAHREHTTLALLFLDLDHFKNINDSLGHAVGDRLLKEMAQRLNEAIREMDTVGRLGGDEFLVVLPEADAEAAAHVAQKLLEESARPFIFESHSLTVTPSIGIALYPKDGNNFDELLKTADTAMYRAKDEGRNGYRFYTPEMNQAVFQSMVLESSMRRAIENKEFVLHYQPKFELSQHRLVGVEALIRWHQPEMGMVSPAHFIPVAEQSGLIVQIGTWVLEEACRQCRVWRDEGLPPLRIAVNLSARQLAARNVVNLITDTLLNSGLPGNGLEMEITESLLATDTEHILTVLQALKALDVHVAVDDFGTGYSSLSYLKRFPIDRLKIDQSFVRDLVTDADDRAIATAVVTLGHSLGIRVIAEGVETKKQMEILREIGCDEVQGYYLGRPIPVEEMTRMLREIAAKPSREA